MWWNDLSIPQRWSGGMAGILLKCEQNDLEQGTKILFYESTKYGDTKHRHVAGKICKYIFMKEIIVL